MTKRPTWHLSLLLNAWSFAACCAALSHLFLPLWTAQGTVWPSSANWQREIAYFDLLLSAAFVWIARQPDTNLKIKAFWAIAFLSIALGHNHLQGWGANVSEPKPFHIVFSLGNLLALVWAAGCLIYERVWQPNRY